MTVYVQVTPTNVSFYRVMVHELTVQPSARSGYFRPNGGHRPPAHKPLSAVAFTQANMVPNGDDVWFGFFPPSQTRPRAWQTGACTWDIPVEWWAMTGNQTKRRFAVNDTQVMTIDSTDGTSSVTKFGETNSRTP